MPSQKRRKLDSTIAALQNQYGPSAVRKASELSTASLPSRISTGIPQLDAATGCDGVPLGHITILNGRVTSGKTTVAYLTLANAQEPPLGSDQPFDIAILDLAQNCNLDYIRSCGVDPDYLFFMRPHSGPDVVDLLIELVRRRGLRTILVNSLPDLTYSRKAYYRLNAAMPTLNQLLRNSGCAIVFLDDPNPVWLRWLNWDRSWAVRQWAGLHIQLKRESLIEDGRNAGYSVRASVLQSRWPRPGHEPLIKFIVNGHVTVDGKTRQVRSSKARGRS